jgi:hypothetical protein
LLDTLLLLAVLVVVVVLVALVEGLEVEVTLLLLLLPFARCFLTLVSLVDRRLFAAPLTVEVEEEKVMWSRCGLVGGNSCWDVDLGREVELILAL